MNTSLVIFKNNGKRKDIPITDSDTIIGRQPDCNIRILKSSVSRKHCRVTTKGEQVTISDLKSSNGTYVNHRKIKKPTAIQPGDIISVADVQFVLTIDGNPSEINPPEHILQF